MTYEIHTFSITPGHDVYNVLDNIPRYVYMVHICSEKEAVIRGTP